MHKRFVFFLILSLLASAYATASAQGIMAGTRDLVICTGSGPKMLMINTRGEPVAPMETCPECLTAQAAPLPDTAELRPDHRRLTALRFAPQMLVWDGHADVSKKARSPPNAA